MYRLIRPFLFALPPESAHEAALAGLRLARPLLPAFAPWLRRGDAGPAVEVCGLRFPNVLGLAAGFDKAARAVDCWQHLGFGHVELGTVTAQAQPGNPKPRVFRYPGAGALINHLGFNNPGADAVARRLESYRARGRWPGHPVGVSIGKSKATPLEGAVEDYLYTLERLARFADYVAVNVSSPNTPGLRRLQGPRGIRTLVAALSRRLKAEAPPSSAPAGRRGPVPLFVKLAPDLSTKDLCASADAALAGGAGGLILTNTTLARTALAAGPYPEGGLSGRPLGPQADACLKAVSRHTRGRVPLIGVGGVFTREDLRRKLDLGAVLVQAYTGFVYGGPGFAAAVQRQARARGISDPAPG